ncbi:MAG: LysM peptidoglycan-binding domain-containing protein [Rikenellaceae bacterium]|nr:LysM peptidoglycan-binding domain-containing protein [Rikenellaceae bacterium]
MNISQKAIILLLFALFIGHSADIQGQTRQTREEYIDRYHPIAIDHMERYGIPASITLAQGILESDCGNSFLSRSSNNHFGIKCKKNWTGKKVYHDDDEKGECFRAYPTVEASYEDHAEFLDKQPRYDSLFVYAPDDYRSWARGLKAAGYATAPDYAQRLIRIIEESRLYLFDREGGSDLYARRELERFEEAASVHRPAETVAEGVDPDNFQITLGTHGPHSVHRCNGIPFVRAQRDDTFELIAKELRISAHNLRKFNELESDAQPLTGEVIFLERKKKFWQGSEEFHTAAEGESLFSVSQRYGIQQKSLRKLNKLKRGEQLFSAGARIRLR